MFDGRIKKKAVTALNTGQRWKKLGVLKTDFVFLKQSGIDVLLAQIGPLPVTS